jgi:O-antigen/teichoic acid export membrane protein
MKALSITLSRLGFLVHKGSLAVLDQCLFAGTNFLVNILLARWLSPEHYGAFVLAFSIFLFLSGFHNALILDPMSVLGPVHYKDRSREYLSSLLWIHAGLTLGLAIFLVSAAAVFLLVTENLPMGSALMGQPFQHRHCWTSCQIVAP